ncbi:MAG TPA: HlyD family efflux transporter periplasmic adaptor subunit [Candidatus Marinimicrobia bacterium]|nr:HlyD family efflux transporter periplasmic adaptor subunit [Candidatus Neomarinimicrobiota bacterium]
MKKNIIGVIIVTMILTFFVTRYFILPPFDEDQDGHGTNEQQDEHGQNEESNEHDETGLIISISPEELKEFDIVIAKAGPGSIEIHQDLTGEIVIDPDRLAHIGPRFPGIVKEVHKQLGDHVNKGEILAIIESNESLTSYEVRSLIEGTIIETHLTQGEMVTESDHSFTIADLSEIWVNLSAYQKDLAYIKVGQTTEINFGQNLPPATGTISFISPILDEHTRTATARVILKNPDGLIRPGLFVTGKVIIENFSVDVSIPKTALQTIDDQPSVFIQTGEGFKPNPVHLGKTNNYNVEIISGLIPGQKYISQGGFTLKAQLAKGSFDGGH